ncbi:MAG TPA: putative porin [Chitinophagales bacterium]|nr:putative porin [Chitinophagales bacterium]
MSEQSSSNFQFSIFNFRLLITAFLFSIFYPLTSFSQDTTFRYYPQFTKYTLLNQPDSVHSLDTAINFFYRYHPAERPFGYRYLGYLGAPESPLFFIPPDDADIDIGFHQFDLYWRTIDDVKFYDTHEPFTSIGYQQGSRNEILASVIHSQNITPNLSFGIDFGRMRADGWYQRQTAKISNFNAYVRYHSPNNLYQGMVAFVLNDLNVQLNGGVPNQKIFSDSTLFDKSLAPVFLDSANSIWKNDELLLLNALNFGKWIITEKKDSVVKKRIDPKVRLQHRFEWEKRSYFYSDASHDGPFYTGDTLDLIRAADSLILHRITNEIRLSKLQNDTSALAFKFSVDAFLRHSVFKIQNKDLKENFQSAIIGGAFSTLFFSKLKLNSFGELNLIDRNSGDFVLDASLDYFVAKGRTMGVEAKISRNHPSVIEQEYQSAYFNWDSSFVPMTTTAESIFYIDQKLKIKITASFFSQSNFIYWVGYGTPVQLDGSLTGFNISLVKNFRVWRIHLDNEIRYQTFSADTVIAFPSIILRSSLYYEDDDFKHALQTKTGIEVHYNDDYFAPGYQPAIGQFPVQHNSSVHYYPVADLFVAVKVKAVRGFLMIQNLTQGILGNGNFSAYHYPMPDRAFKVGLQWMFWN